MVVIKPAQISSFEAILLAHFPSDTARYFVPMKIGGSSKIADEGAALILAGIKTATSSTPWHYSDGRMPFVGALSVLLDGADRPRGIVETTRVQLVEFSAVDADFAYEYGEGPRTLEWWREAIGEWYLADAAAHGRLFRPSSQIICEWFRLVARVGAGW